MTAPLRTCKRQTRLHCKVPARVLPSHPQRYAVHLVADWMLRSKTRHPGIITPIAAALVAVRAPTSIPSESSVLSRLSNLPTCNDERLHRPHASTSWPVGDRFSSSPSETQPSLASLAAADVRSNPAPPTLSERRARRLDRRPAGSALVMRLAQEDANLPPPMVSSLKTRSTEGGDLPSPMF